MGWSKIVGRALELLTALGSKQSFYLRLLWVEFKISCEIKLDCWRVVLVKIESFDYAFVLLKVCIFILGFNPDEFFMN